MSRWAHSYRVTFADGTFYDQDSSLNFQAYIEAIEAMKWMTPDSEKNICFNMKTVVKIGRLR